MLRSIAPMAALLTAALAANPIGAAPMFNTFVEVNCGAPEDSERQSANAGDAISCDAGLAQGFAQVNSGLGRVRLLGTAGVSAGQSGSANARGRANGQVRDNFTISALDAGGGSVTSGFFTAQIGVHAELMTSGAQSGSGGGRSGDAILFYVYSVGSVSSGVRRVFANPSAGGPPSAEVDTTFDVVVPWTAGIPIDVRLQAEVTAQAGTAIGGNAFAEADFQNTFDWRGILSVRDASGSEVASFTALNDQGFDYAASVPEPGAALLALAGLVGLAGVGRRR